MFLARWAFWHEKVWQKTPTIFVNLNYSSQSRVLPSVRSRVAGKRVCEMVLMLELLDI